MRIFLVTIGAVAGIIFLGLWLQSWSEDRIAQCTAAQGVMLNGPHGDVCIKAKVINFGGKK